MNTARIVVLTIAVGAIGAAACSARGADSNRPSTEPVVRPLDPRSPNRGPLSWELNRFTAPDIIQAARDDRAFRRGDDIQVAAQK
jgi:hypothetical protein